MFVLRSKDSPGFLLILISGGVYLLVYHIVRNDASHVEITSEDFLLQLTPSIGLYPWICSVADLFLPLAADLVAGFRP